ncbi:hypothetical protein J7481_19680 [Labrenzia sp. R4_2]|uniref:hypothetical protein n=1 Tax=Labrenzia sp. R4_2 TaxID=2821107 RepID=UPI001AD977A1|nr:hypothetical protein [Labrenzia sp. R4_2]MBO9421738.1 hypothetical protein [Labrenzia sp. R4_2]
MTKSPPWTLHEFALLIGLQALGEEPDYIADALRRPFPEVMETWHTLRSQLRGNLEFVEAVRDEPPAAEPKPVKRQLPKRKFRVVPFLNKATVTNRDVTAELMGDPSVAAARRAGLHPPAWRPETSNR